MRTPTSSSSPCPTPRFPRSPRNSATPSPQGRHRRHSGACGSDHRTRCHRSRRCAGGVGPAAGRAPRQGAQHRVPHAPGIADREGQGVAGARPGIASPSLTEAAVRSHRSGRIARSEAESARRRPYHGLPRRRVRPSSPPGTPRRGARGTHHVRSAKPRRASPRRSIKVAGDSAAGPYHRRAVGDSPVHAARSRISIPSCVTGRGFA